MDQTYLDDLLQIPRLKSQDAASLKTFANRLHRAVLTLSQSRYAHELHSRTTLMAIEAKLTTYLEEKGNEKRKKEGAKLNVLDLDDWVTVKSMSKQHEEGSKVTASSPSLATPMGRRQKTEQKVAEKTNQWRCLACNGRANNFASCIYIFHAHETAEVVFESRRCLLYYASPASTNAGSVPETSNILLVDELDQDTIPCFTDPNSSH
ncbi:hypothetical protein OUZ56_026465 [Daphnia magna]|uniref:Uncharacterized protein n=1 Tax=Daphnia magna TaxID=35525 RepID=A0ABQ9ZM80_9CRUS|nr:hypothetical protein OUZ56_026465 [Daphnia magna]